MEAINQIKKIVEIELISNLFTIESLKDLSQMAKMEGADVDMLLKDAWKRGHEHGRLEGYLESIHKIIQNNH